MVELKVGNINSWEMEPMMVTNKNSSAKSFLLNPKRAFRKYMRADPLPLSEKVAKNVTTNA
jgi:hypothetical protein